MKSIRPATWVAVWFAVSFSVGSGSASEDEIVARLRNFRAKVEALAAPRLPDLGTEPGVPAGQSELVVPRKPTVSGPPAFRTSSIVGQLKLIESAFARGEFEKAEQLIPALGIHLLPPDLQSEWRELGTELSGGTNSLKARAFEKWRLDVDQLVVDTRAACLAAKTAADLDALLIRSAPLQMRRSAQEDALSRRIYQKLTGAVFTLEHWARYLDYREAQNEKAANASLKQLLDNQSQFPVLSRSEVEGQMLAPPPTLRALLQQVFEGVTAPEQIPLAVERMKTLLARPLHDDVGDLRLEGKKIEVLLGAWGAFQRGDHDNAVQSMGEMSSYGTSAGTEPFYARLADEMTRRIVVSKVKAWSELSPNEGESVRSFLVRVLDELSTSGNLAALVQVMKLHDSTLRISARFSSDRAAIEWFLAGQRLEAAGDSLAAIAEYRAVVGAPLSKYVPTQQASDSLQRLKEKHPEAFSDQAALQELRTLRQQTRAGPGQPGYLGRPTRP